jgi:hypothetical protein
MTNDDLPPLPHGKVWVNYRTHGAEGVYTADQLRAVQREAYEAGKRQGLLTDKPVTGPACNLQRPWEAP